MNIYGYFDEPGQTKPTFDPGLDVLCPVCLRKLYESLAAPRPDTVGSVSVLGEHSSRCYFFRFHKKCWDAASPETQQRIECAVIDAEPVI